MVSFGFDTEQFIIEIEDRPAIWDVRLKEYSNKTLKAKAWEELCSIFAHNFNELDCQGKNKASKYDISYIYIHNILYFKSSISYIAV